jgi:hypothetical protein
MNRNYQKNLILVHEFILIDIFKLLNAYNVWEMWIAIDESNHVWAQIQD